MIVPRRHAFLPTQAQTRTRRPLSGMLAYDITVGALHAYLSRTRPCVTHQVEGPAQSWEGTAGPLPVWVARTVRIRLPLSDRAALLAVALTYRSDGDASITLRLWDQALVGVLDTSTIQVQSTRQSVAVFGFFQRLDEVTTGAAVFPAQPRLLRVGAPGPGQVCLLEVDPPAAAPLVQICSVSVYEITADLEEP